MPMQLNVFYFFGELRRLDISLINFSGNKFITPMVVNGKVYVGTPSSVAVFGLLP